MEGAHPDINGDIGCGVVALEVTVMQLMKERTGGKAHPSFDDNAAKAAVRHRGCQCDPVEMKQQMNRVGR